MAKADKHYTGDRFKAGARYSAVAFLGVTFGTAALPGLSTGAVWAQTLPPATFTTVKQQSDIIAGQNKTGPYTLAWSHLLVDFNNRVDVVSDGRALAADEFTVDAVKGTITFRDVLKSASVARIGYAYDTKTAVRNADFSTAPVSVPLLHVGNTDFHVTALAGGTASGSGVGDTRLVYGLNRTTNLLGGGLTSQALFGQGGGSAMKLGYNLGNDRNGLTAQFQRAERGFATSVGKSFGMADPTQYLAFGARLRPMTWFGTTFTRSEQHDLTGKNGGKQQDVLGLSLGGIKGVPTLNLSRTEDEASPITGGSTQVATDKLDLAAAVGSASITAKGQRVTTDAPIAAKDTTAQNAVVAIAAVSTDKKQQASLSVTGSNTESATQLQAAQAISLKLQPAPTVTLSTEQKSQTTTPVVNGKDGTAAVNTTQSLSAEIAPMPGAKLTGAVQTNELGDAKTSVTDLNAQIGTGKALEIAGGRTNRSASTAGGMTLDTTRARVALRPFGGVTLTGGYTLNPEDSGKVTASVRQEVGLTAKMGALELGSGYKLTTLNNLPIASTIGDPQFGEISLTLGLRFSSFTKLNGSYKDGLLYGAGCDVAATVAPRGQRVYGLGLTHILGQAVNFSMGGTMTEDRAQANKPPDYKAEAKLGLKF